jgi:hypothetical protein
VGPCLDLRQGGISLELMLTLSFVIEDRDELGDLTWYHKYELALGT